MLTPEAEASIAAHRNRQQAWIRGEKPLVDSRFGARTLGAIAEIVPGVEIWTCEDGRRNHHEEPLGGIVLHADAGGPPTVTDDGEIVPHPATYRCYDHLAPWPHRAFTTVREDEINRHAISAVPTMRLVIAVRRFCREACRSDSYTLDGFDAQLVTDAARLVAVIMGGTS